METTNEPKPSPGDQVRVGMSVVGSDSARIGTVKKVRGNDFLVERTLSGNINVPFTACQSVSGDRVMLNIRADQVEAQGWPVSDPARDDPSMTR